MTYLRVLIGRLLSRLRLSRLEDDFDEEVRVHLEMAVEEKVRRGMTPTEARYAALREFGGLARTKESYRDQGSIPFLETLLRDLHYGMRMCRRQSGFTLTIVITMALAIGITSSIFSITDAALWKPFPYADPGRLVAVHTVNVKTGGDSNASAMDFLDWTAQPGPFQQLAAFRWSDPYNMGGLGQPERVQASAVSANFFATLGVAPTPGRDFGVGEASAGQNGVTILNRGFWERRFGSNPDVVGKTITLDGKQFVIAGVAPRLHPYLDADLYYPLPFGAPELRDRNSRDVVVIGRLKSGMVLDAAKAQMNTLASALRRAHPEVNANLVPALEWLRDYGSSFIRPKLLFLLGAVSLLLLIACANTANLLVTRVVGRTHEFAVRAALGAGRRGLVRQLLTETLLLGVFGGALGIVLAGWGASLLRHFENDSLAHTVAGDGMDARVLVFTFAITLLATLFAGMIASVFVSRGSLSQRLMEAGRTSVGSVGHQRVRRAFVRLEIALAVVLLAGAGLFIQSLLRLHATPPGFDPRHLLTMRVAPTRPKYTDAVRRLAFYDQLLAACRALPGVGQAAAANGIHLNGVRSVNFAVDGREHPPAGDEPWALNRTVTSNYFQMMRIPLRRGRYFTDADGPDSQPVVIINENLANQFFKGQDPVGQRLILQRKPAARSVIIVGVAANVKELGIDEVPFTDIYEPLRQNPPAAIDLALRTGVEPTSVAAEVRQRALAIDPDQALYEPRTMEERIVRSFGETRFYMSLIVLFAAVALVLSALGVYGVVAHSVAQRTGEIAIRMALGATAPKVTNMIVRQGASLALSGVAVGLGASVVLGYLLRSALYIVPHKHTGVLFQVSPYDPVTLCSVGAFLTAVVLLASFVPSRRAAQIDPMEALRV